MCILYKGRIVYVFDDMLILGMDEVGPAKQG